jgi:hypothetical protein
MQSIPIGPTGAAIENPITIPRMNDDNSINSPFETIEIRDYSDLSASEGLIFPILKAG